MISVDANNLSSLSYANGWTLFHLWTTLTRSQLSHPEAWAPVANMLREGSIVEVIRRTNPPPDSPFKDDHPEVSGVGRFVVSRNRAGRALEVTCLSWTDL